MYEHIFCIPTHSEIEKVLDKKIIQDINSMFKSIYSFHLSLMLIKNLFLKK
jgi:hypothetical protein